jgi:hypothetical protein
MARCLTDRSCNAHIKEGRREDDQDSLITMKPEESSVGKSREALPYHPLQAAWLGSAPFSRPIHPARDGVVKAQQVCISAA